MKKYNEFQARLVKNELSIRKFACLQGGGEYELTVLLSLPRSVSTQLKSIFFIINVRPQEDIKHFKFLQAVQKRLDFGLSFYIHVRYIVVMQLMRNHCIIKLSHALKKYN